MDPLNDLPVPLQLLIGTATFGLILLTGHFVIELSWAVYQLWRQVWGMARVVDSDGAQGGVGIPTTTATDTDRHIRDAGYLPLGRIRRTYPRLKLSMTLILRTSEDERTTVSVVEGQAPLEIALTTWFADNTLVMTGYPSGYTILTDRIACQYVSAERPFTEVQAYHDRLVAAWTAQGHTPLVTSDVSEYLRQQAYFRQHYQPLLPNPRRTGNLLLIVPNAVAIFGALALLIAIYTVQPLWAAAFGGLIGLCVWARGTLRRDMTLRMFFPRGAADQSTADTTAT